MFILNALLPRLCIMISNLQCSPRATRISLSLLIDMSILVTQITE